LPEALIESMGDMTSAYQTGIGAPISPNLEKLTSQPPIGFEQFVGDHMALFQ